MSQGFFEEFTLATAYAACAVVGIVVVVVQLVLGLFGGDGEDGDGGLDLDTDDGLHLLTIRGIASFLTVFGLLGWIGALEEWPRAVTLLVALGGGALVWVMVAVLLRAQRRLHSAGTIDSAQAVGQVARVYLRIPAKGRGMGKITVEVQGRTAEYTAFTRGAELATGAQVRVVAMAGPDHFEVVPLEEKR